MIGRSGTASKPIALVIGLSVHGLAVTRSLAKAGIEVHAIEQNRDLPGCYTRFGKVHFREGINSEKLIDILRGIPDDLPGDRRIVLFPTSDRMVSAIAKHWPLLNRNYLLSWAEHRNVVLDLQRKDGIQAFCERSLVPYPKSLVIHSWEDCERADALSFPLAVKPVQPLSKFKVIYVDSRAALENITEVYRTDLPFLAQEWVEGDDTQLFFCTMYLSRGRIISEFVGRKIRAFPPGTGVGTIVESYSSDEVLALARRFVADLDYSGPIAIEFKRDPQGRFWLIEPNLGRTEYSVDLLIQHGINLPVTEYLDVLGTLNLKPLNYYRPVVWFDTERDPAAYLTTCVGQRSLKPFGKQPIFPYYGHRDPIPFVRATWSMARRLALFSWTKSKNFIACVTRARAA